MRMGIRKEVGREGRGRSQEAVSDLGEDTSSARLWDIMAELNHKMDIKFAFKKFLLNN